MLIPWRVAVPRICILFGIASINKYLTVQMIAADLATNCECCEWMQTKHPQNLTTTKNCGVFHNVLILKTARVLQIGAYI